MVKLYDEDAYLTSFDAVVTGAETASDGTVLLALDRTAFFPEEGGQSPDRGTIEDFEVTDVQIAGDGICHTVSGATAEHFPVGAKVHGEIDWEHRFRNMQMHTGEHIFSGLVNRTCGYDNVGFHLSDRTATMDYNGKLTEEQIHELEMAANRAIADNRSVTARYPEAAELANLSYRSKKAIDGPVRLVEIEGIDLCACCAPHVRRTGEVGGFKIIGWENYKGGVRVSFRCGLRAVEDYEERLRLLGELSRILSVKTEDLADAVAKLQTERRELAYRLVARDREAVSAQIASAALRDTHARDESGRIAGDVVYLLPELDASMLRYAVDLLKKKYAGIVCALLPAGSGNSAAEAVPLKASGAPRETSAVSVQNSAQPVTLRYIIEQDGGNVSEWQKILRERFGAKGGGPKNSVQGSLTGVKEEILSTLRGISNGEYRQTVTDEECGENGG